MKIIKKLLWIAFVLFLLATIFCLGYYVAVTRNVSLDPQKLTLSEKNVVVYDADGEAVKGVAALSRAQTVPIADVPEHVRDAFVSTEDKRFYKHGGFDVLRIGRAFLNNVKAGGFKEGASTISQQLIKNTHLSQEKTVKRKLQEWKLTRQLEKQYDKDEILEKYLNTIYFGHSCFGIASAADFYFQKTPRELTLSEGAILAGLVKSPNNYSPFKNPEKCQKRLASVLSCMQANGKITDKQGADALQEPLPTRSNSAANTGFLHFVFDELSDLSERYAFTVGGNVEIETGLDQALQTEIEELAKSLTETDETILVLDNEKGLFKGCVSSVGEIRRLPGSLIKPLLVYAPALEENVLSPATPILDEKINYGGYSPENYGGVYHGYVSMRTAVEKSLNVPAVKTLEVVGVERAAKYMQALRLPIEKEDYSLALALGGMKNGFTLGQLSAAYAALANGGTYQPCGFIAKIKINGATVYTKPDEKTQVFSPQTAYLMTDVLRTTAISGTAKKLRSLPCEIAAKTGTVGTACGNTDAYALSYTAKDLVGVWLGNADNKKIEYTGGGLPCSLLLTINEYLCNNFSSAKSPQPKFSRPQGVVEIALDKTAYEENHALRLADEAAPTAYTFKELFQESAIPLNKSTSFSNPTIPTPALQVKNGAVHITFDERAPKYYRYKIERTEGKNTVLLYEGEFLKEFTDDTVEMNKRYIYTVTPLYENRAGERITLPAVSPQESENLTRKEEEMIEKKWWEY